MKKMYFIALLLGVFGVTNVCLPTLDGEDSHVGGRFEPKKQEKITHYSPEKQLAAQCHLINKTHKKRLTRNWKRKQRSMSVDSGSAAVSNNVETITR